MSGRRVMLFDNGKLGADYGPFGVLFESVSEALQTRFDDPQIVAHSDDLLRGKLERLDEIADWVVTQQVAAVVFALCDWGVSQPTAILAARREGL
ncbi:MAG: hypothetical protein M3492_11220 [Actinomycetota bacterium]|nr:hypothetical protein [Actinomycetota bacterium]